MPGFSDNTGVQITVRPGDVNTNAIVGGSKWTNTTVTFNFPSSLAAYPNDYGAETALANFQQLAATQQTATATMLNQYLAPLVNMTFNRVADTAIADISTQRADLLNQDGTPFTVGYAYLPATNSSSGDIWYRNTNGVVGDPVLGNYSWATFLHEIGHAMGLKHGHEVEGAIPTMTADRNSMEFSVMTYAGFIGAATGGGYQNEEFGYAQTYMIYDIAALQFMYGANYTTNAGSSVYTFNADTGEMSINGAGQGAPGGNRIFRTVWDGGGVDTYDLSNYTTNLRIDLAPGGWSTFSEVQLANLGPGQTARANLFNALLFNNDVRSLIENATGGTGNDSIVGNQIANLLLGNGGDDTFFGGLGADTFNGGLGVDTANYAGVGSGVTVRFDLGFGVDGTGSNDTYLGIENAVGTDFADVLAGLAGVVNRLEGGIGDDVIYGEGIDVVLGGTGNNVFFTSAGAALNMNVAAAQVQTVWGGFLSDTMDGSTATGNLTLIGQGPTADSMTGGSGNDFVYFRNGDQIAGGAGTDWAVATLSTTGVNLSLGAAGFENAWGSTSNDTLNGSTATAGVTLVGDVGNDVLIGSAFTDFLYGFGGGDSLTGGGGNDVLAGGSAADHFIYNNATFGVDLIYGYETGVDRIDLAGTGVNAFNQLTLSVSGGNTTITAGAFGASQIFIVGVTGLTAADFSFV